MILFATDWLPWIAGIGGLSAVALVLIVVAPSRSVRADSGIDEEAETRLLLGEDPAEIDREMANRADDAGSVSKLHPDEDRGQ
jgi:hypothetical protein